MINSKKKGNKWELDISHLFSEHFKDEFRRVPQSGAVFGGCNRVRATGVRQDAQEILSGDVIVPEWFEFSIECKSYKDLELHQIYTGKCARLDGWIEQGENDAEFAKKKMLLLIKLVRKGTFACVGRGIIDEKELTEYTIYKNKYLIIDLNVFLDKYKYQ